MAAVASTVADNARAVDDDGGGEALAFQAVRRERGGGRQGVDGGLGLRGKRVDEAGFAGADLAGDENAQRFGAGALDGGGVGGAVGRDVAAERLRRDAQAAAVKVDGGAADLADVGFGQAAGDLVAAPLDEFVRTGARAPRAWRR